MADLAITANNVAPGTNATNRETLITKEVVTAGQGMSKDVDGKLGLWDSNSASAWKKVPYGIAMNGAQINQPVTVHKEGKYTVGAAVAIGTAYFMSSTPGSICVQADVTSGMNSVFIGIATSVTEITVKFVDNAVLVP